MRRARAEPTNYRKLAITYVGWGVFECVCLLINHQRICNFIVQTLLAVVENDHDITDVEDEHGYVF